MKMLLWRNFHFLRDLGIFREGGLFMLDKKKLSELNPEQLLEVVHFLSSQVDSLTSIIQREAGLADAEIRDMDRIISEKTSGLIGDIAGEIVDLTLGNERLASDIADVVSSVGDTIGRLFSRYSPITIGSLVGGNGDGQNGWYYIGLNDTFYDTDLSVIETPAGLYRHDTPGAPTHNDGAFGRCEDGVVVASSYEVYWRGNGSNQWVQNIPNGVRIGNPKIANLVPGAYVFGFDSENVPSREDFNGIGKHSRRTHAIVHVKPSGERVVYHAYFGQRLWVQRDSV